MNNYIKLLTLLFITFTGCTHSKEILKQVSTGSTPLYRYNDTQLQDLSGAAYVNGRVYLASDGGKNSDFPEVRVTSYANLKKPALLLQRQIVQRDIEGATQSADALYLTSSMSQVNDDTEDYRVLAEIKLNDDGSIFSERYIYARDMIISAMEKHFGDTAWLRRVKVSFGKNGGLNVEGLSVSDKGSEHLVFGFRSPLVDDKFGSPELDPSFSLTQGLAIIMQVSSPFDVMQPATNITLVDLNGQGIRGMEYIPALNGYIIISGGVEKLDVYDLWLYEPKTSKTTKLSKAGDDFSKLCRPEAVLNIPETSTLLILSEESGNACANVKFNYVEYSY